MMVPTDYQYIAERQTALLAECRAQNAEFVTALCAVVDAYSYESDLPAEDMRAIATSMAGVANAALAKVTVQS